MIRHLRWAASAGVSRRRAWAGVTAFFVVSVTAAIVVVDRAKYLVRETLGAYASVAVTEVSRGTYQLSVSDIDLLWWRRTISVGAIRLTTNSGINDMRGAGRLPETRVVLQHCSIRGLHLMTLVLGRGLSAASMGCASVAVDAVMPPKPAAEAPRAHEGPMRERRPGRGFLVLQKRINLPGAVPRIRIRQIEFPHSAVRFAMQRTGRAPLSLRLDRFSWSIDNVVIDPRDTAAANRPLFSDQVRVAAVDFTAMTDSTRIIRVGSMHASLTDSLVEVRDIVYEKPGRTHATLAIRRVAALGIDVGTFAAGDGIEARKISVDSMDLRLDIDKRRRGTRGPRRRDTPQQWIASEVGNLAVDTLTVTGDFTMRERRSGPQPATLRFVDLALTAANVRHVRGRTGARDDVMTLTMATRFQGAGWLRATFEIPLDAPRGDMRYSGSLGRMDAAVLNPFLEQAAHVRITSGRITDGIRFNVTVRNGVARGTVTPLYDQLRVKVLRQDSHGILGSRGTVGAIARRLASFVANERYVRDDNPDEADKPIRVGRVYRVREPGERLPSFVWNGLRDGLLSVVRK